MAHSEQSKGPPPFRVHIHFSVRTLPILHYELGLWMSTVLVMIVEPLTQHKWCSETLYILKFYEMMMRCV